jgi:hypothetical protein
MSRSFRRALLLVLSAALVVALVPVAASASDGQPPVPGAEPFLDGWAVPISTQGPAWYDLDYYRQVLAGGDQGAPLPDGVEAPASGLVYPGIRPGQWLVTVTTNPVGFAWCTANFVFVKNGTYGLGTAGHCAANDALGAYPDVTAYVVPPVGSGSLPGFYHIGKFVLSHNNGIGDDFAMIQLYPQFNGWVSPTMPVFGGPIGTYTSNDPTVVEHFGHGAVVGTGGTPRTGAAPVWTARGGNAFAWYGASAPGDSGSAVNVVTNEAAGDLTHIVILDCNKVGNCPGEILPGMIAGTRITKILQIASGWTLVNGSLIPV